MNPLPVVRPPEAPDLVGIARLAFEAESVDQRNDVDYRALAARSCLNRQSNPRLPFRWTINPYRGCEFGCAYCYARYTHEYMELRDPRDFERRIFVKQGLAAHLARELRSERVRREWIAIGTATDPYQPVERRQAVTRSLLEVLAAHRGLDVSITTKSDLVLRDLDLLSRIAARSRLSVNLSVATADRVVARALEPRAPTPEKRLGAVRALRGAGIDAGVFCAPVLPFVTDGEESLGALFGAAREAGAGWLMTSLLFLKPSAARAYLPRLAERFPEAARRFAAVHGADGSMPPAYRRALEERIERLRERHGFARMGTADDAGRHERPAPPREEQGRLDFGALPARAAEAS